MRLVVFPLSVLAVLAGLVWLSVGLDGFEVRARTSETLDLARGEALYVEYLSNCGSKSIDNIEIIEVSICISISLKKARSF